MQNIELYLSDQLCDLGEDEVVMSFGANKLQDLETRQGNYSNTFRIPMTIRNKKVIGIGHQGTAITTTIRSIITAKITEKDMPIVEGFAVINSTKNDIELTIFSGNSDWISAIGDKKLNEIDLSDLEHIWNSANVEANRLNTYESGFLYPNVFYGAWLSSTNKWQTEDFFPAIYWYRIVIQIFTDAGFNVSGSLLENALFRLIVCLHSQASWANRFRLLVETTVREKTTQAISSVNTYIGQDTVTSNHAFLNTQDWGASTPTTFLTGLETYYISGSLVFTVEAGDMPVDPASAIEVWDYLPPIFPDPAVETFLATVKSFVVVAGVNEVTFDNVELTIGNNSLIQHYMAFSLKFNGTTIKNTRGSFKVVKKNPDVYLGGITSMANILSQNITQLEFLKDVFNRFGVISSYDRDTNTVILNSFEDINSNKANAIELEVDYSEAAEVMHSFGDYAQSTLFINADDKDDPYISGAKIGDTSIEIEDSNKPTTTTVYESPFAPIARIDIASKRVAIIPIRRSSGTSFDIGENRTLVPKIGHVVLSTQNLITQYGESAPSYSAEIFFEAPEDTSLSQRNIAWDYLLQTYSAALVAIIQNQQLVRLLARLKRRDVTSLDFSVPVYLNTTIDGVHFNGYYYLNFIDQYKPGSGESCYIELLPVD